MKITIFPFKSTVFTFLIPATLALLQLCMVPIVLVKPVLHSLRLKLWKVFAIKLRSACKGSQEQKETLPHKIYWNYIIIQLETLRQDLIIITAINKKMLESLSPHTLTPSPLPPTPPLLPTLIERPISPSYKST